MWDLAINFVIGLVVIGIPSYVFYRVGIDAGIERGVRRQLLRELTLSGIVEMADTKSPHRQPHSPA
ncbi:hypothetical protein [Thiothrix eikelboomii]|uniref:Uncharacterized protein n=1 Tax=Thiothrix eikelboomii TaxID=92487 RepID=A0A1T4X3W8_9GAMM|nr:hypothetical protein [Thiothrix eikelboomii]SKA83828.1 hypothetical protein SAMN02745130_02425 [Thiothrix eikelboomii]